MKIGGVSTRKLSNEQIYTERVLLPPHIFLLLEIKSNFITEAMLPAMI